MQKIKTLGFIILVLIMATSNAIAATKTKKPVKSEPPAQEQVDQEQASTNADYAKAEVIEDILKGDLNNVPFNELWVKQYLLIIAQSISQECKGKPISQSDYKNLSTSLILQQKGMTENNLGNNGLAYGTRVLEDYANKFRVWSQGGSMQAQINALQADANDKAKIQMRIAQDGVQDAGILLNSYKCGTSSLSTFSKNLVNFVTDVGAERVPTEELSRKFSPFANPNHTSGGARFGFCLALKVNHPDMIITRAQRLGLYKALDSGDKEEVGPAFREIRNANYHKEPDFEDCYKITN